MKKPIKLLVIAPYPIFPLHSGGKIRIFQLANHLSKLGSHVTIISPFKFGQLSVLSINRNLSVHSIKYPFFAVPFLLTDRPFPYQFLVSFHPGYKFFLRQFLTGYDIYQFEHASFSDMIQYISPGSPIIYNSQNVEFDYVRSEARNDFAKKVSSRRLFNCEKRLLDRSRMIFACSENDKERFRELYGVPGKKFLIVPNGISSDPDSEQLSNQEKNEVKDLPLLENLAPFKTKALFSGSNVEHNRIAVNYIVNRLAPECKHDCAFIIKGSCGKPFLRNKSGNVFIDPTGGNIGPYAEKADVAINPVMQGSGTSMKLLDYLHHRLPVLTTPFGIRGFDDLRPFVKISELSHFPRALTQAPIPLDGVGETLRKYSWHNCARQMLGCYRTILEEP